MLGNTEILEFFKDFKKEDRAKCIEQVLIYGIREIKKKYQQPLSLIQVMSLNEFEVLLSSNKEFTQMVKENRRKSLAQDTDRMRFMTGRGCKENICPDTTCLPLKIEYRRAHSTQLQNVLGMSGNQKEMTWKKNYVAFNESLEKETEVIKLADEFLKNPFAKALMKKQRFGSPKVFIDSTIFSTIEMTSPIVNFDM